MGVMRNSIMIFFLISLVSCSSDEVTVQFRAEKAFAKAERIRRSILINPNLASQDLYQRAITAYKEVITSLEEKSYGFPNLRVIEKNSWGRIAELFLMQGDTQAAIETYKSMTVRFPDDSSFVAGAYLALGTCYERLFAVPLAIQAYENVVKYGLASKHPTSLVLELMQVPLRLARLKRTTVRASEVSGSYAAATHYYEDIASKWPKTKTGLFAMEHLAAAHADLREWNKTIKVLETIIRRYPETDEAPQALMALGNIYATALRNPKRGLKLYERLLAEHPNFKDLAQVHLAIASVQISMGQTEDAVARYRWVLEQYSSDTFVSAQAQLGIARSYEARREWEKAINEYRWLADSYPLTLEGIYAPLYVAQWYDRRGKAKLARAEYDAAVQRYNALAQKYPRSRLSLMAQQYLSFIYSRLERWRSALSMLGAIREQHAESPAAIASYLMSASIYERLGDFQRASESYVEFIERFPNHPLVTEVRQKLSRLEKRSRGGREARRPTAVRLERPLNLDGSALRLSWTESSAHDFSVYKIYRSTRRGVDTSATLVTEIDDPSVVVCEDRGIEPGVLYFYRVFTFDSEGLFAGSNEASGRAIPDKRPSAIRLEIVDVDFSGVELRWTAASSPSFAHYKVLRAQGPDVSLSSEMLRYLIDPSVTSFRDERVVEGKTYYYRVYVFTQSGKFSASNQVSATIPKNRPPQTVRLQADYRPDAGSVHLKWSINRDEDFSMYRVYRSEASPVLTAGIPLQIISDNLRVQWDDSLVQPLKTYYYKVLVVDLGGLTSESNEVVVRVP